MLPAGVGSGHGVCKKMGTGRKKHFFTTPKGLGMTSDGPERSGRRGAAARQPAQHNGGSKRALPPAQSTQGRFSSPLIQIFSAFSIRRASIHFFSLGFQRAGRSTAEARSFFFVRNCAPRMPLCPMSIDIPPCTRWAALSIALEPAVKMHLEGLVWTD